MAEFTFDTFGLIYNPDGWRIGEDSFQNCAWDDLDPFTQGYVEALARTPLSLEPELAAAFPDAKPQFLTHFSDLAPETLAAILKDCEAYQRAHAELLRDIDPRKAGARYRHARQKPESNCYAPLTPYLGDDGKVYLREGL